MPGQRGAHEKEAAEPAERPHSDFHGVGERIGNAERNVPLRPCAARFGEHEAHNLR
jgi:hypothetical protein